MSVTRADRRLSSRSEFTLEFVPLQEEFLEEIMEIEAEAYPEPWTIGMFREEMKSKRSYFFVAFSGETLVGYGGFWLVLDEAHVTSVTVRKNLRGCGYGREEMLHLLSVASEMFVRVTTLEVRQSNAAALALYADLGFRAAGLRKGYYSKTNEDAIIMVKNLQ